MPTSRLSRGRNLRSKFRVSGRGATSAEPSPPTIATHPKNLSAALRDFSTSRQARGRRSAFAWRTCGLRRPPTCAAFGSLQCSSEISMASGERRSAKATLPRPPTALAVRVSLPFAALHSWLACGPSNENAPGVSGTSSKAAHLCKVAKHARPYLLAVLTAFEGGQGRTRRPTFYAASLPSAFSTASVIAAVPTLFIPGCMMSCVR